MARPPRWNDRLARAVRDHDGITLRTRDDARRYMLALSQSRQGERAWQHAAELLLTGAGAAAVTDQLELALLLDGRLDVRFCEEQRRPAVRFARLARLTVTLFARSS